ncbi:hypothetical protein ACJX0J_029153, partial [Zea mays]
TCLIRYLPDCIALAVIILGQYGHAEWMHNTFGHFYIGFGQYTQWLFEGAQRKVLDKEFLYRYNGVTTITTPVEKNGAPAGQNFTRVEETQALKEDDEKKHIMGFALSHIYLDIPSFCFFIIMWNY